MRYQSAARLAYALVVLVCAFGVLSARGEASYVPPDANQIDITKPPYSAVGDGKTDCTEAVQRAVSENLERDRTIYFPPGVYVISRHIEWKGADGIYWSRTSWRGAGRGSTILRLADRTSGFGDPAKPRPMVTTGSNRSRDGAGDAAHDNYIYDMTFDVGDGNPGAIGLDYNASNNGALYRVEIVSPASGSGLTGLALTRNVGPCLIKDVTIRGFDRAVHIRGGFGLTIDGLSIERQRQAGIVVEGNCTGVSGFRSVNTVPAVQAIPHQGLLAMIDSELLGGDGAAAAIEQEAGRLFLRNVRVEGYRAALVNAKNKVRLPPGTVVEHVSHRGVKTLFETEPRSLDLKVPPPPVIAPSPPEEWASVVEFGAEPAPADSSKAIQRAIDSGATTVYFPQGHYTWAGEVVARGKVRRIMGYNSLTRGRIRVAGTDGPVAVERFRALHVVNDEPRHPVLIYSLGGAMTLQLGAMGWYAWDTVSAPIKVGRGQFFYGWQTNCENAAETQVRNDGGIVRIVGYKNERFPTNFHTTGGGQTEVIAGLMRTSQGVTPRNTPSAINDNSFVSLVLAETAFRDIESYDVVVREMQGDQTREWTEPGRGQYEFPLYVGRPGASAPR